MNPDHSGVEIKTIRGDFRDKTGAYRNRLRLWEKTDFAPRPDDVFQERLYCIQWIAKESIGRGRQETFFATVSDDDIVRELRVEGIVRENLVRWQTQGNIPDMPIEPGDKTDEPIRTRGWTYWHHLFSPRDLHFFSKLAPAESPLKSLLFAKLADRTTKLCGWATTKNLEAPTNVFANQALTPMTDYCIYSSSELLRLSNEMFAVWVNFILILTWNLIQPVIKSSIVMCI